MIDITSIAYLVCTTLYIFFLVLLVVSWRGRLQGALLICAAFFSVAWGLVHTYQHWMLTIPAWLIFLVDIFREIAWLIFVLGLLNYGQRKILPGSVEYIIYALCLLATGSGFWVEFYYESYTPFSPSNQTTILSLLILSLIGLVLVEQLYRNSRITSKNSLRYLSIALGCLFVYDIYTYSSIYIFKEVDSHVWILRAAINACLVPILAIFARRNPELSLEVFVSRHVVFYTTSLIGMGVYLLVVALGGYYIYHYGGERVSVFQAIFFVIAAALLIYLLTSSANRARLKIFLTKHFYENKYDYREEWMRINSILSEHNEVEEVGKQVIVALVDLLDAKGAQLWLKQQSDEYACVESLSMANVTHVVDENDTLIKYFKTRNWVVDIDEYMSTPDLYGDLEIPFWLTEIKDVWLIIPIQYRDDLLGFVLVKYPMNSRKINWEDRDLLKVVIDQLAGYLAIVSMSEALDRAHQFEAFNRLSAYVVHDLKNLVAQLGLLVANADKHKNNPEFFDDVIKTVKNAVSKMDRLLSQLRKDRFQTETTNITIINNEIKASVENMSNSRPIPEFHDYNEPISYDLNRDRFTSVMEHLIRNAQEATAETGHVDVYLSKNDKSVIVKISDTGQGMDKTFIQNRLFRPFDTTKGNAGMGIGVYEAKNYIQKLGGKIKVSSQPEDGTTFIIELPISQN